MRGPERLSPSGYDSRNFGPPVPSRSTNTAHRTLFAAFAFLISAFLLVSGCKRDDFVKETLGEAGALATDMVKQIADATDKKAGVAEAQKALEAKKGELGPKFKELGELRGFEVSEAMQATMQGDLLKHVSAVEGLKLTLMSQTMSDDELDKAVDKLTSDYSNMLLGQ